MNKKRKENLHRIKVKLLQEDTSAFFKLSDDEFKNKRLVRYAFRLNYLARIGNTFLDKMHEILKKDTFLDRKSFENKAKTCTKKIFEFNRIRRRENNLGLKNESNV